MPYVQKIPNRLLRSEWATRIAQQLRLDEPVLRAALSKAASERRSEVKTQPELVGRTAKPVERRLIRMLAEAEGFRRELAQQLQNAELYQGLETEKIFAALIAAILSGTEVHITNVARLLGDHDRKLLFEIIFESFSELTWQEAIGDLDILRAKQIDAQLHKVREKLTGHPFDSECMQLQRRVMELQRLKSEYLRRAVSDA